MAQFILTIPDNQVVRIVTAFCTAYKYQAVVTDPLTGDTTPNPETPTQFSVRKRIEHIKETVKSVEVPDLAKEDRQTRADEIDAISITLAPYVP